MECCLQIRSVEGGRGGLPRLPDLGQVVVLWGLGAPPPSVQVPALSLTMEGPSSRCLETAIVHARGEGSVATLIPSVGVLA
jgi:hypothetical protein